MHVDILVRNFYLLTYLLSQGNRDLLVKRTGLQLVNKFPTCYSTPSFITAHHLSLSSARSIQSILHIPLPENSFLYYPTYICVFQVVSFPQVSPPKPCTHLSSPQPATCPAHLILLDLITRTLLDEE